jgi:hypothetical protein
MLTQAYLSYSSIQETHHNYDQSLRSQCVQVQDVCFQYASGHMFGAIEAEVQADEFDIRIY